MKKDNEEKISEGEVVRGEVVKGKEKEGKKTSSERTRFVLELSIERDFYYYLSLFHFSSVTPACLLDFRKDRRY